MNLAKRAGVLTAISLTLIGCDQATKSLAATHLPRGNMLPYFNDLLRVGYTENTGAFLGLGSDLPSEWRFWIFVVATGLLLAGLAAYLLAQTKTRVASVVGLSLMFAGGLSNFYDRLVNNGAVVDFLNVGIGSFRTGIFNVADIAITCGFAILLLVSNRSRQLR